MISKLDKNGEKSLKQMHSINSNHHQTYYQTKNTYLKQNYKGKFGSKRQSSNLNSENGLAIDMNQLQNFSGNEGNSKPGSFILSNEQSQNLNKNDSQNSQLSLKKVQSQQVLNVQYQNETRNQFPARSSLNPFQRYGHLLDNAKSMMKNKALQSQTLYNSNSSYTKISPINPLKNENIMNQSRQYNQQEALDVSNEDLKLKLPQINDGFIPKTNASISFRRTLPTFRQNCGSNERSKPDFQLNIVDQNDYKSLKQLRVSHSSNFLKPFNMSSSQTQMLTQAIKNNQSKNKNFRIAPTQPQSIFQTELFRPEYTTYSLQAIDPVLLGNQDQSQLNQSGNNLILSPDLLDSIKHKLPVQKLNSRAAYTHSESKYGPIFQQKSRLLKPTQSLDNLHSHSNAHFLNQSSLDTSNMLQANDQSGIMNTSQSMEIFQTIMNVKNEHLINQNSYKLKKDLLNTLRNYDDRLISFKKAQKQLQKVTKEFMDPHYQMQDNSRSKVFPIWNKRGQLTNAENILNMSFNSIFSKQFIY
eukprot:403358766